MKRIHIRHTEADDAGGLKAIYEQASSFAGTLQLPFPSLDMWQHRLQDRSDSSYNLVAEIDGKVVGNAGLETYHNPRRHHAAHIGVAVHEEFRNQGVASALLTEIIGLADRWLGLRRIELEVYTDNDSAKALYKKHGFVTEGVAKCFALRDGEYVDVLHMARVHS